MSRDIESLYNFIFFAGAMHVKYQDLLSEMFELPAEGQGRLPVTDWATQRMPDTETPERYTKALELAQPFCKPGKLS